MSSHICLQTFLVITVQLFQLFWFSLFSFFNLFWIGFRTLLWRIWSASGCRLPREWSIWPRRNLCTEILQHATACKSRTRGEPQQRHLSHFPTTQKCRYIFWVQAGRVVHGEGGRLRHGQRCFGQRVLQRSESQEGEAARQVDGHRESTDPKIHLQIRCGENSEHNLM